MRAFRVIVGVGQDRHGYALPLTERQDALDEAYRDAVKTFGGYTVTSGAGGFEHDNGDVAEEYNKLFFILADSATDVQNWALNLAQNLGQESVILIHPDNLAEFIEPAWAD